LSVTKKKAVRTQGDWYLGLQQLWLKSFGNYARVTPEALHRNYNRNGVTTGLGIADGSIS